MSAASMPSVADVAEAVTPWVVSITVKALTRGEFFTLAGDGAGSGFIVRPDGYVVTNAHLLEGATDVKVHLDNGDSYEATVVGYDIPSDLAVLKIEAGGLPLGRVRRIGPPAGGRLGYVRSATPSRSRAAPP